MSNIKYFTFEHSKAGFTDQLRYFNALYSLGSLMQFRYLHTPFISPRSGVGTEKTPSAHEFIGVNAHFQRSGQQISGSLCDLDTVEVHLPEIVWSSGRSDFFEGLVDHISDTVRVSFDKKYEKSDSVLINFKLYEGNKKKFCKLIFENVENKFEENNIRAIYSNARILAPHRSLFKTANVKMLVHVRQGDTAILSTPWHTFVPVRFKRKDFLKEYESYNDIEKSTIFSTSEILSFLQDFINYYKSKKITTLVFSDGWKRAFKIIYKNIEKMNWDVAKVKELKDSEAVYDEHQFQDFSKLKDISLHIGEEPEKLLDLIHSAVESDIVVCTSQQAMMPKLVASLCDRKLPTVIILYKHNMPDDSSILPDYKERFIYVDIANPDFSFWTNRIHCF